MDPAPPAPPQTQEDDPLPVLHRDHDLVAVTKPAGLVFHRDEHHRDAPALVQAVRDRIGARVYPVQRLDKATSGIVVLALSPEGAAALQRVLMSVYFLRCQIVHGGATLGSELNRVTVEPASRILGVLSSQLLALVVEHGLEMEWGPLNYPPVRDPEEDERG